MEHLATKIAIIGIAGIAAQWIAWRLRIPGIAMLLLAGFILGPVTGYLDPAQSFGDLYRPMIALAVAVILFEGGLTLNFSEIKETSGGVRRIVLIGGPLVWLFSTLAGHYAAGLTWPTAAILGAIFVITGPTVIMPLLRQAQLSQRPASLLRWEAIVNDPLGALYAVIAFEVFLVVHGSHSAAAVVTNVVSAAAVAVIGGYAAGKFIGWAFIRGYVPEFLKAPMLFATVLGVYAISDIVLEESGLLTVTIMGITLANSRLASLGEMRRFKETVTVLLVSGLFIMLTASFDINQLTALGWRAVLFVVLILVVVRPAAIFLSTIGSTLNWKERSLVAWIAPRGIVAVAVSGLFGNALTQMGIEDGSRMTALAFAVVVATILLHGFSLGPLSSALGLKSAESPGVLIAGGTQWTQALSEKLTEIGVPVLVTDSNWNHIRDIRLANVPVHFGELLSEAAHHSISFNRFSHLIAATDNDSYNSLVCTEFGPEIGRSNVFQIGKVRDDIERNALHFTLGGRPLFNPGMDAADLRTAIWKGHTFQATGLTDEFDFSAYQSTRSKETSVVLWVESNGTLRFAQGRNKNEPRSGDTVVAFGPPTETATPSPNADRTGLQHA